MTLTKQYLIGSSIINIIKLLFKVKFRISFKYIIKLLFILFITTLTFPFFIIEQVIDFFVLRKVEIKPPIFIIGHWRSGTTHLQNILCQDDQFGYITTLQATTTSYMFLAGKLLRKLASKLLWKERPVDNMDLDIDFPQEEEYAMASLSPLSIYHSTVFPRNRNIFMRFASFKNANNKDIDKWKKQYIYLLKKITYMNDGKQLILKNPVNTFRIQLLKEMFPNARFIYLERNTADVFASMTEMYKKLFVNFQLQNGNYAVTEEVIYDVYKEMIQEFNEQSKQLIDNELVKVQYENLISDTFDVITDIYQHLEMHICIRNITNITNYIEKKKDFKRTDKKLTELGKEKVGLLKSEFDIY